jgi:putative ABC transport system permease protein
MTKPPLSVWKYYHNNQKKGVIVFTIVFLGVFLQSALLIYVTTMKQFYLASLPFKALAFAYHIDGNVKQSPKYRDRLTNLLSKHPAVAKILPFGFAQISLYGSQAMILALNSKEIKPLLNALNLSLVKGQLPTPGSHAMALHWKIAASKGLKIGNQVSGLQILKQEYHLVGLLDGDLIIGFSDLDTYLNDQQASLEDTSWLIAPKKGKLKQVKNYLAQCIQNDKELHTSTAIENALDDVTQSIILISTIIYLVISGIVTICVSFLFYLNFYQRRPEFGLLEALGHKRQTIFRKALLEIGGINLFGSMLGVAVCLLCGWTLNCFILTGRGLPLLLWVPSYTWKLLLTPLFATFISLLPVWRLLTKVDPTTIIEGE